MRANLTAERIAAAPIGRLMQVGDTLHRQLSEGLREYHAIHTELVRRYPDVLWPSANEIIEDFWKEIE